MFLSSSVIDSSSCDEAISTWLSPRPLLRDNDNDDASKIGATEVSKLCNKNSNLFNLYKLIFHYQIHHTDK